MWKPKAAAVPQTSLFYESVGGQDYLLAMVTPPTLDAAPKLLPRELIFVIDNSGSMAGTSIVQAKQSLLFALGRLRPGDKFNVVRFDDTLETLFDTAVDASSDNLAIAKHFVSRLDAAGGTEMLPALEAALKDATPEDTTRLRQVVFLTDGSVGNEAQLFEEIAKKPRPLAAVHGGHRLSAQLLFHDAARPSSAAALSPRSARTRRCSSA